MTTPIYTQGPSTKNYALSSEYPAPLSEVLSAEAEQAWRFSPLSSIGRNIELDMMQGDERIREEVMNLPPAARRKALRDESSREIVEGTGIGQILTTEEAKQRIKESGVSLNVPKTGVTSGALNVLIERKKRENAVNEVISRADGGIGSTAARLGVGLGVTMLDPINLASAFIPVVGPTRYAGLLAQQTTRLGRAGVRARVGAVEGAVGAAVVEPVILSAAKAEQADYDLADSMLNIAFGTIMGGGLHAGGGAIADALRAKRSTIEPQGASAEAVSEAPEGFREEAARSAISQFASGRVVDIENVVGNFTPVRPMERRVFIPGKEEQIIEADVDEIAREIDGVTVGKYNELQTRQQTLRRWIDELADGPRQKSISEALNEYDNEVADLIKRQTKVGGMKRKKLQNEIDRLSAEMETLRKSASGTDTPDMKKIRQELIEIDETMRDMAEQVTSIYDKARSEAPKRAKKVEAQPSEFKVTTVFERDRTPGIGKEIEKTFKPQNVRYADFEASKELQERIDNAPDNENIDVVESEVSEVEAILREKEEAVGVEKFDLSEQDALLRQADEISAAMKAGTSCMIRRS